MIEKVLVETHCHTLASTHAYSTLAEMASFAHQAGLSGITVTDHAPALPDAPHEWHFHCQKFWPDVIEGIRVYQGAEVNIIDKEGRVDLDSDTLNRMDLVVASIHGVVCPDMTAAETTDCYLQILSNPAIDVIGHSGTPEYAYDIDAVMRQAKEHQKVIEINNHSFAFRKNSIENCVKIAQGAKRYGVYICVSTDAHICYELGHCGDALAMLSEIDFPQELIVNRTRESFEEYIYRKKN